MAKNSDKVTISFVGSNAHTVTGSMTLVEYRDLKILVDAGLYQSNSILESYRVNSKKFKFKPEDIDYIFITHINIDHFGMLPRLYKEGCRARIITHHNSVQFFEDMLIDSGNIHERDSDILFNKGYRDVNPVYSKEDVKLVLPYVRGCDIGVEYELNGLSFKMFGAGHIIGAVQIMLIFNVDGVTKTIGFSGDLGNIKYDNPYVEKFEPIKSCNIFVGESTYGDNNRNASVKARDKDLEKLESAINTFCVDGRGRVLIPCFALQRTQTMLTMIYNIFKDNSEFNIPVMIDSPLASKITKIFEKTLIGKEKDDFDNILKWKNLKIIQSADESKAMVECEKPKIVLSASGMMTNGRSIHWARNILPRANDCIITCGFMSEGSLGYRITNGESKKTISIAGKRCRNKCNIVNLTSFSSHMQYDDLIEYYASINTNKIYLVHGDMDAKLSLKQGLEDRLRDKYKTTRVVCVEKTTKGRI